MKKACTGSLGHREQGGSRGWERVKDGFLCLNPGVGPKVMFRMSRVRGRGSLAIGHHPQEDWETTHRLAWDHSQLRMQGLKDGSEEARRLGQILAATDGPGDGARMGRQR